ncbi:UNC93-like protein isoform X2 [Periplaneta americana]|uniref:UNC93-like protein isoform X2 n=1 Tax=Periplaneta americana TaxID=6978 RepID=UPI0037E79B7B
MSVPNDTTCGATVQSGNSILPHNNKSNFICETDEGKTEEDLNMKSPDILQESQFPKTHSGENHKPTENQNNTNILQNLSGKNKWNKKFHLILDVLMVSLAFMVHFTAFIGTSNLQSSVNAAEGLGTTSLMTIYVGMSVSSIFLPVVLIKWLGCKWTLVLTMVAYIPYIVAQVYARFYTLIPAAFLVGMGAGPLWCVQGVYINTVAEVYSELVGLPTGTILARFFGIFFMLYQTSEIWGNLISSVVFSAAKPVTVNENSTTSIRVWETCGYNFCPGSQETEINPNLERPPEEDIFTIAGIYLACMVLACLMITFGVNPLKRYNKDGSSSSARVSGSQLLVVTIKLLGNFKLLLLIPLTLWMGIEQVFRGADYTAAYISCAWGISNIGYVLVCYGVTNSIASLVTGYLVKYTGRLLMVLSAMLIQIGITTILYVWTPDPVGGSAMFFVISGLWGVTDAVWLVQISV